QVAQDHVEAFVVAQDLECLAAALGHDHLVVAKVERDRGRDRAIVVDDQDPEMKTRELAVASLVGWNTRSHDILWARWKRDLDRRALTDDAVDRYLAAQRGHEVAGDREPETERAAALRGEKWLEDPRQRFGRDSRAAVLDRDRRAAARVGPG